MIVTKVQLFSWRAASLILRVLLLAIPRMLLTVALSLVLSVVMSPVMGLYDLYRYIQRELNDGTGT